MRIFGVQVVLHTDDPQGRQRLRPDGRDPVVVQIHEHHVPAAGEIQRPGEAAAPEVNLEALQRVHVLVEDMDAEADELPVFRDGAGQRIRPGRCLHGLRADVFVGGLHPAQDLLIPAHLLQIGLAVFVPKLKKFRKLLQSLFHVRLLFLSRPALRFSASGNVMSKGSARKIVEFSTIILRNRKIIKAQRGNPPGVFAAKKSAEKRSQHFDYTAAVFARQARRSVLRQIRRLA